MRRLRQYVSKVLYRLAAWVAPGPSITVGWINDDFVRNMQTITRVMREARDGAV